MLIRSPGKALIFLAYEVAGSCIRALLWISRYFCPCVRVPRKEFHVLLASMLPLLYFYFHDSYYPSDDANLRYTQVVGKGIKYLTEGPFLNWRHGKWFEFSARERDAKSSCWGNILWDRANMLSYERKLSTSIGMCLPSCSNFVTL